MSMFLPGENRSVHKAIAGATAAGIAARTSVGGALFRERTASSLLAPPFQEPYNRVALARLNDGRLFAYLLLLVFLAPHRLSSEKQVNESCFRQSVRQVALQSDLRSFQDERW